MLIIFRSQNRNEAVIYRLSMLGEQNARYVANILQCHLCLISKKPLVLHIVKLFINPSMLLPQVLLLKNYF